MKISLLTVFAITFSILTLAQGNAPVPTSASGGAPEWGHVTKAAGDSCGTYFNNYIGLTKTSGILTEYMRTGSSPPNDYYYNGRAQRFTVSQPVEVSGVEFYAYHESLTQDSVMVITSLHSYNALNDSLGAEITRDTCYVTHTAFTLVLPTISVKSYFDAPVLMSSDYVIAMHSNEDENLIIITNDYNANDGNGEGFSFLLYDNPLSPGGEGWYSALNYILYDVDYLMSPLVKYDLYTPFTILNDTICPDAINAGCVSYAQVGNFTNHMYNSQSGSATTHNRWLWGDGFQNVDLMSACHTYANAGTFNINLRDTLFRHDFASPYCIVDVTQPIVALDVPISSFSFTQDGLSADFTNTSTNSDSVWWDFGDGTAGTDLNNPSHSYTTLDIFDVWLYAYNQCHVDSTMLQVVTDDAGLETNTASVVLYPNPATSQFVVSGLSGETQIELLNILGEKIYTITTANAQETISVMNLPTGTYFVKISQNEKTITKKIVVKH